MARNNPMSTWLSRIAPAAALCAVVSTSLPSEAQDTLLFTARVPPNVLLAIDNSNSMNEIMRHPASVSQPPPGWPYAGCNVLPNPSPSASPFPYGPNYIDDEDGNETRYDCFPGFGCWFVITPSSENFTVTPTGSDDPDHGYITRQFCGVERKIWHDGQQTNINGVSSNDNPTWVLDDYLEWLFHLDPGTTYTWGTSPATTSMTGAQILADIDSATNGRYYIGGGYFGLYQRSRMTAVREVARDVIYKINTNGQQYAADCRPACSLNLVRFGLALFNTSMHGGHVRVPIGDYSSNSSTLDSAINNLDPATGTPLNETLFKLTTYFMPRDPNGSTTATRALGVAPGNSGTTRFPPYKYRTSDGAYTTTVGDWPADPVQQACQKNFIIMLTDGQPSGDDFSTSGNETLGFSNFKTQLVGNYAPDTVGDVDIGTDGTPEDGNPPWNASDGSGYLDDIAMAMQDIDIRPDMTGEQNIDVYTLGLATDAVANRLLEKTAQRGNGIYRTSTQAQELADALVTAIEDILNKAQAFTSAAVPASRTTSAENFYTAFFVPAGNTWFWEGHLKNFDFSAAGDVLTADGFCAVGASASATPPCATNGTLRTTALAFWDAATAMPAPNNRKLYVDFGNTAIFAQPTAFVAPASPASAASWFGPLVAADLTVTPYSTLTSPENTTAGAARALIRNLRGCTFSGSSTCTEREDGAGNPLTLGDIFHSNPIVVGPPNAPINESAYRSFATTYKTRTRVIYAGANDGFLHGFHAGDWNTSATPPVYTRGTGQELMGFMPYGARRTVKDLIKSVTGLRTSTNVDGSPVVADVWFNRSYSGSTLGAVDTSYDAAKNAVQWRTVLMQGLRDGGQHYSAIDITDPPASVSTSTTTYPRYLWSFPADDIISYPPVNPGSRGGLAGTVDEAPYMGNTWSEPVITRVKVLSDDSGANPAGYERWVAVFGGGYHLQGDPNSSGYVATSLKGRAIYMVDINTGEVLAKKYFDAAAPALDLLTAGDEQKNIREMRYAIPSAPAIFDLDFDGFADVIYIGDLGGNLWKWVVTAPGHDPIHNTTASYDMDQPSWPFRLLFRGSTSTEPPLPGELDFTTPGSYSAAVHYQSFFYPPTGAYKDGRLILAFGSGERAEPIDAAAVYNDGCTFPIASPEPAACKNNNHFYVVKDDDPYEITGTFPARFSGRIVEDCGGTCTGEGDLLNLDSTAAASVDCNAMNSTKKGFYITGRDAEKFVSNSTIFLNKLFTGSFRQRDPASTDICGGAGTAYLYVFDIECGVGDWDGDHANEQEDRRLAIGSGLPTRPRISTGAGGGGGGGGGGCSNRVVLVTSDGGLYNSSPGDCPGSGIQIRSWRER
jgi:hypothetical protein